MNQGEIQALIENIDRLQISLDRTQGELNRILSHIKNSMLATAEE